MVKRECLAFFSCPSAFCRCKSYFCMFSGADDIFLFINTWKDIHATQPDWTILEQLTHTLSRGGKAMVRSQNAFVSSAWVVIARNVASVSFFFFPSIYFALCIDKFGNAAWQRTTSLDLVVVTRFRVEKERRTSIRIRKLELSYMYGKALAVIFLLCVCVCVLCFRHIKIIPVSPPSTFINPYCTPNAVNSRGHKIT